jgi:hypothetical protein
MTDRSSSAAGLDTTCGVCDALLEPSARRCEICGVDLTHPLLGRYIELTAQLEQRRAELQRLRTLVTELETQQLSTHVLLTSPPLELPPPPSAAPWAAPPTPAAPRPQREWNADRIRDALLWTGGALVALAALSFVAVLWSRENDDGSPFWTASRVAVLLLVVIAVTCSVSFGLRKRLPATAEVVAVLTLALAGTEWYAIRRAGLAASVDTVWWWSVGSALAAIGAFGAGRLGFRALLAVAPMPYALAATLVVVGLDLDRTGSAVGFAIVAAGAVVTAYELSRSARLRVSMFTMSASAAVLEMIALATAIAAATGEHGDRRIGPAAALAALALAPAAARWRTSKNPAADPGMDDTLVAAASLAVMAGAIVAFTPVSPGTLLALIAAISAGVFVMSAELPSRVRTGVSFAGAAVFLVLTAWLTLLALYASLMPLGSLDRPWSIALDATANDHLIAGETDIDSGLTVVAYLIGVALAFFLGTARARRIAWVSRCSPAWLRPAALAWCAIGSSALLPTFTDVSVTVAAAVTAAVAFGLLATAPLIERRLGVASTALASGAAVPYLSAIGWAFNHRLLTVTLFGLTAVVAGASARRISDMPVRSCMTMTALASALAAVAAGALALDLPIGAAGVAIAVCAATMLCITARASRGRFAVIEAVPLVAMGAGMCMGASSGWTWAGATATALTVGLVAAVALGAWRTYLWGALLAAGSAVMCWFAAAGVDTPLLGLILTATCAVIVIAASSRRGTRTVTAVEWLGVAGVLAGIRLSAPTTEVLAGSLTLASATIGVAAVLPRGWKGHGWVALALGGLACSAWLASADVRVIEAYTLTWAAGALAGGAVWRRGHPDASSWLAYGPGLVTGLLPSAWIATTDDDLLRTTLVVAAALVSTLIGAKQRLQAPLLLGLGVLTALGVDAIGPTAADAPRWIPLGIGGVLLLWLGATTERRFEQARQLRDSLGRLG